MKNLLTSFKMLKVVNCYMKLCYLSRSISICKIIQTENRPKRKVRETVELVTLIDQNDKILGLKPKLESQNLAKKLNLLLERVHDTKYGKMYPAYKMFSYADLLKEEKRKSSSKVFKKLPLNAHISDHDLSIKMQIIKKWVAKDYEVHVAITRNNHPEAAMKTLFSKIQDELKNESKILDVKQNEDFIKFIIITKET